MPPLVLKLALRLHRSALLRRLARRIAKGWSIRQSFHGGVIFLDAVDHSWSWTGGRPMERFDPEIQDCLLELARPRGRFLDLGCNIGVMTLAVLLRSPHTRVVAFDPNRRAIELLARSLRSNRLEDRAVLRAAAVSAGETTLPFDARDSFTGHVATAGPPAPAVSFASLVAEHAPGPVAVKIDVEGYESRLADAIARAPVPSGSAALLELHPAGFNGLGDPHLVVRQLQASGRLRCRLLGGGDPATCDPANFHQLLVEWPG